jgi:hypothetical protein
MAPGYRQLVKRAVAAYFGGAEMVALEGLGIYYSNGPLYSQGLTTAWPYQPKGVPDELFFSLAGQAAGAIMTVELAPNRIIRQALGGPVSGWRDLETPVICHLFMMSTYTHAEQAETFLDDLIEAVTELIYLDRTLGTTNAVLYPTYPDGRLIVEAGEKSYGISQSMDPADVDEDRGRTLCHGSVRFNVGTYWQS